MGSYGVLWRLMGGLWSPMESYGVFMGSFVSFGVLWGPLRSVGSYGVFMGSFASYGVLWGPYGVVTSLSRSPHRMQPLIPNGRTHPSHNDPTGRSAETDGGSA